MPVQTRDNKIRAGLALGALLFTVVLLWLGYRAERADTWPLLSVYAFSWLLAAAGFWYCQQLGRPGLMIAVGIGLFVRLALIGTIPNWSEDIFRFVWDGHLWLNNVHPFQYTPQEWMQLPGDKDLIFKSLYESLNSAAYYTVYPPVDQAIFYLSAWLSPGALANNIIWIKLPLLAGELTLLAGLIRLLPGQTGQWAAIAYALNPLAILETCGNAHFEGLMMAFCIWALYFLQQRRMIPAGICWALAIATKLTPLLLTPLLLAFDWRRSWQLMLSMGATLLLLFVPMLNQEVIQHMAASVELYFQQFEFNASLYYVAKFGGNLFSEWDTGRRVSPVLALLTVLYVLFQSVQLLRKPDFQRLLEMLFWCSMVHLLNSTTVHPWYVLVPLVYGLAAYRYSVAWFWTLTVAFSYTHYENGGLNEHFGWILAEYGVLSVFLLWQKLKKNIMP